MRSDTAIAALRDIAHHLDLAFSFTAGFDYEAFVADPRTVYAVTHCLEIISEASRRLPDDLKAQHPSIAWRDMAGAGSIYCHDYEDVAVQHAWDTVQIDPTPLRAAIIQELVHRSQITFGEGPYQCASCGSCREPIMNRYVGLFRRGAPLMPENVADPPSPSCFHLFPDPGIQEFQRLGPDRSLLRARERWLCNRGSCYHDRERRGSGYGRRSEIRRHRSRHRQARPPHLQRRGDL
jgi:uncharacterized protein with HEPN domain